MPSASAMCSGISLLMQFAPQSASWRTQVGPARTRAGVLPAEAERVQICGFDALRAPVAAARIVAWVSVEPMIYVQLTPVKYLELVAGLWSLDAYTAETRARGLIDWLGI